MAAAAAPERKTCLYEVLSVERTVDADALKKAYKKAALKWHPDKNPNNQEEATAMFKTVREAYETLSDPHERAWYDSHREAILRGQQPGKGGGGGGGGDDEQEVDPDGLNLFQYFSAGCYNDYSDAADGFYTVYASIFERLSGLEMDAQREAGHAETKSPQFGTSTSEAKDVRAFYSHWQNFVSCRTFSFRDKWNLADASSRPIRRAMEKENQDARRQARREYNENVRNLARFARKRDKRVMAYEQKERAEEQARAEEVKAAAAKSAKAAKQSRAQFASEEARRL